MSAAKPSKLWSESGVTSSIAARERRRSSCTLVRPGRYQATTRMPSACASSRISRSATRSAKSRFAGSRQLPVSRSSVRTPWLRISEIAGHGSWRTSAS